MPFALIRNIYTEGGISALMIAHALSIYIDAGLLPCRRNIKKYTPAGEGL